MPGSIQLALSRARAPEKTDEELFAELNQLSDSIHQQQLQTEQEEDALDAQTLVAEGVSPTEQTGPQMSASLAHILGSSSKGDPEDLYVRLNLVTRQTDKALTAVQSLMKEQDRHTQNAEIEKVLGEVQRL